MRVCNPDGSPVGINRRNTAPTPSGFAEIVSDDLPVLSVDRRRWPCVHRCGVVQAEIAQHVMKGFLVLLLLPLVLADCAGRTLISSSSIQNPVRIIGTHASLHHCSPDSEPKFRENLDTMDFTDNPDSKREEKQ